MKRYLLFLSLLFAASAAFAEDTLWTVSDAASFAAAVSVINASGAGSYTIVLVGSFTAAPVEFTGGTAKIVILRGNGGARTISNGGEGLFFTLPHPVLLILENNVILDGNNKKWAIINIKDGAVVMRSGSALRGAASSGVYVGSDGSFTMEGGIISGNNAGLDCGGGVAVDSGGSFTMTGGMVSGNTGVYGGGVVIGSGGVFTMKGGMVAGNATVIEDGYGGLGGGVFAGSGSSFIMSGGTIDGNTADYGGGVYARGSFTMSGGTIGGNTAGSDGGGVLCDATAGGIFVKSGGSIDAENKATSGRAVYMWDGRNRSLRNAAADSGVNMDSRKSGRSGGWEGR